MKITKQIKPHTAGVIITSDANKYNLMRKLGEVEQLVQLPIFTLREIKSILNGEFDQEAIVALVVYYEAKHQIKLNINVAKKYLQTMESLSLNQSYDEVLLQELQAYKQQLATDGLFIEKKYRQNLLKNKQIYTYDVLIAPELITSLESISQCQVIELDQPNDYQADYYEFNTIYEEVEYISNEIANLIASGISSEQIKIHIPQGEYINVIMMYFSLYNIEHDLASVRSLLSYDFIQGILVWIKEHPLTALSDYEIKNDFEQGLYNQAIEIINRYPSIHDNRSLLLEFLQVDFANASIKTNKQTNVVSQIDWETCQIDENEYLFCFNFAEGRVPKIKQDTAIISDNLALKYGLATSSAFNVQLKQQMLKKIQKTKHLVLSFARNAISGEEAKSSLLNLVAINYQSQQDRTVRFSQASDLVSVAKAKELKLKYDTSHRNLLRFNHLANYQQYCNQITGELYQDILNHELSLSATSIQKFYECEYKFYLNKILKVNLSISDPTMINIGNLYHFVLEQAQIRGVDSVDDVRLIIKEFIQIERALDPQFLSLASQEFYLEKYALYLHEIISEIFAFHSRSEFKLDHAEFEREFAYTLDSELPIKLVGKVDKYVELDLGSKFYIVIIDYKTKNKPSINHQNFAYGFELQNFIYLNLIKMAQGDDEIELIGTYQQRVKPQHLYGHEAFNDDFKLFGYTTSNMNKVQQLEPEFKDKTSSILANAKTKASGDEFDRYAKVYDEAALEDFEQLIKDKLSDVVVKIKQNNYQINPKELKGKNMSCDYCDYRAICYRSKQNMVELKEDDHD